MTTIDYTVAISTEADIDGILALQELNLPDHGGQLSVRMTEDWFRTAISDKLIVVCLRGGDLIGYVAGTPLERQMHVPVIQAMLGSFPAPRDCYVYGPTCVASSERGRGIAGEMFAILHASMGRETAITFIKSENTSSRRAHMKMGMEELGLFSCNAIEFVALTFTG